MAISRPAIVGSALWLNARHDFACGRLQSLFIAGDHRPAADGGSIGCIPRMNIGNQGHAYHCMATVAGR
jgi:hypothetical protein